MTDDGAVRMNFLNIPMTTPLRQKIGLALCTGGVFVRKRSNVWRQFKC